MSGEGFEDQELAEHHVQLLTSRAIKSEVALARQMRTVHHRSELEHLGFAPAQRNVPSLLIPLHNPAGQRVSYLSRPDEPRVKDGKTVKYETVQGRSPVLDTPLLIRSQIREPSIPLIVTEGPLKADAAASQGLCSIAVPGVWSYARNPEILADWDHVVVKDRHVYVAFDSDVVTNPQVRRAAAAVKGFLERRGGKVLIVVLPKDADGGKIGIDDFFAAGHTPDELLSLACQELPAAPDSEEQIEAGPYRLTRQGIVWCKDTRDGPTETPLTNFPARITTDVTLDDGSGETQHRFEIEATVSGQTRRVTVPASQFPGMGWTTELGARAIVSAGIGARDHARAAIQGFSRDVIERHVYTHTGWRNIDGRPVFLSAGGGIDHQGLVSDVAVHLEGDIARYDLPAPPTGRDLHEAVRSNLRLLDVAPDRVTATLLGAVYRAPLGQTDIALHMYGPTGSFKTAIAAVMQQHYGTAMDHRNLPASWESTENALEGTLHLTKDVVCVVDEYVAPATPGGQAILQRKAERIFRATGNQSGRQRMRADGSMAPTRPPRGLVISTGEDRPHGQSLAARRLDIALSADDVDQDRLSRAQREAAAGIFAAAMAGYIRWLAGRYDDMQRVARVQAEQFRREAEAHGQHRRTPAAIAELAVGWYTFLRFAVEMHVIAEADGQTLWKRAWKGLVEIGTAQVEFQHEAEPTIRFRELLRSAIGSGRAHVADSNGDAPEDPATYGWERLEVPQGSRVGWLDDEDLYLDPSESYAVVRRLALETEDPLNVSLQELKHRLVARGVLVSRDQRRQRFTIRKTLQGAVRDVLHVRTVFLFPQEPSKPSKPSKPSHEGTTGDESGESAPENGRLDWTVGMDTAENRPMEPSNGTPETGVSVPDGGDDGRFGRYGRFGRCLTEDRAQVTFSDPPAPLACINRDHRDVWYGDDGQPVCNICHPKTATREA